MSIPLEIRLIIYELWLQFEPPALIGPWGQLTHKLLEVCDNPRTPCKFLTGLLYHTAPLRIDPAYHYGLLARTRWLQLHDQAYGIDQRHRVRLEVASLEYQDPKTDLWMTENWFKLCDRKRYRALTEKVLPGEVSSDYMDFEPWTLLRALDIPEENISVVGVPVLEHRCLHGRCGRQIGWLRHRFRPPPMMPMTSTMATPDAMTLLIHQRD